MTTTIDPTVFSQTSASKNDPSKDVIDQPPRRGHCRFCGTKLEHSFVDLGASPLCQRHIEPEDFDKPESIYPLHAMVCGNCFLVQLDHAVPPHEIFTGDYAYFSSYSDSWLKHVEHYAKQMIERFHFAAQNKVVEIASNDGYLLQFFHRAGVPVLGVEPTANTAAVAMKKGIPTVVKFFGRRTAKELASSQGQADLLIGNNVLAHVPDLNNFVGGMKILLKPDGVLTMEFPHLAKLVAENQFDTIYHEHWSYFSFSAVRRAFAAHGLTLFDVEELPTHGGSLRIYGRHAENSAADKAVTPRVAGLLGREKTAGIEDLAYYRTFGEKVKETKRKLLEFLIQAKRAGKTIVGYGAPGKGNTLLNYCGIRTDFIDYTVDRSPHKQGRFLPGTRIPIHAPEKIAQTRPDYVLILPWNLKDEIMKQMEHVRQWNGKFIVPIPQVTVY